MRFGRLEDEYHVDPSTTDQRSGHDKIETHLPALFGGTVRHVLCGMCPNRKHQELESSAGPDDGNTPNRYRHIRQR